MNADTKPTFRGFTNRLFQKVTVSIRDYKGGLQHHEIPSRARIEVRVHRDGDYGPDVAKLLKAGHLSLS